MDKLDFIHVMRVNRVVAESLAAAPGESDAWMTRFESAAPPAFGNQDWASIKNFNQRMLRDAYRTHARRRTAGGQHGSAASVSLDTDSRSDVGLPGRPGTSASPAAFSPVRAYFGASSRAQRTAFPPVSATSLRFRRTPAFPFGAKPSEERDPEPWQTGGHVNVGSALDLTSKYHRSPAFRIAGKLQTYLDVPRCELWRQDAPIGPPTYEEWQSAKSAPSFTIGPLSRPRAQTRAQRRGSVSSRAQRHASPASPPPEPAAPETAAPPEPAAAGAAFGGVTAPRRSAAAHR